MAHPAKDTSAEYDLAAPIDRAVDRAENGQVIYLHRRKQETVAVMPAELAHEALDALEDAKDVATMKATDGEPRRPFEDFAKELGL